MNSLLFFCITSALAAVAAAVISGAAGLQLLWFLPLAFAAAFIALVILFLLFLVLISLTVDKRKPQKEYSPFFFTVYRFCLSLICACCRVRLKTEGLELIPDERFLLVSNHRSGFDPIITGLALKDYRLTFISKPENLKIPVIGKIEHGCCVLSIDRDNDRSALVTINAAADLIRRGEVSVGIYPEGTRNRAGKGLLPFRCGSFKAAQRAGAPIVIAAILGSESVISRAPLRSTEVTLKICRVLPAEEVARLKTSEIGKIAEECMLSAGC